MELNEINFLLLRAKSSIIFPFILATASSHVVLAQSLSSPFSSLNTLPGQCQFPGISCTSATLLFVPWLMGSSFKVRSKGERGHRMKAFAHMCFAFTSFLHSFNHSTDHTRLFFLHFKCPSIGTRCDAPHVGNSFHAEEIFLLRTAVRILVNSMWSSRQFLIVLEMCE